MTDEYEPRNSQQSEDRLTQAYEALMASADSGGDKKGLPEWRYKATELASAVHHLARTYLNAMAKDREEAKEGWMLRKDYPPFDRRNERVRRKSGFIDVAHKAEYDVSQRMNHLLELIETAPHKGTAEHADVIEQFAQLARVLDDCGLYLNQGKSFAPKTTMPHSNNKDDVLRTARVHKAQGMFLRLWKLTDPSEDKDRGR